MASNSPIASPTICDNNGSYPVTIPADMARALEIEVGETILFRYEDEPRRLVLADKVDGFIDST